MNFLISSLIIGILVFSGQKVKPQSEFASFIKFANKNWRIPISAERICRRQNVLIKVYPDIYNKIERVEILNDVAKEIPESLNFLIGYQFDKKISLKKRPIIYCIMIDSFKTFDCDSFPQKGYQYKIGTEVLAEYRKKLGSKAKGLIFIDQLIVRSVYDRQN